jgi:hypothetical protein
MKLVLGNITFETNPKRAIVHEINGIIKCEDMVGKSVEEVAIQLGEEMCNMFGAYVIPDVYTGEIIYEVDATMRAYDEDEEWEDDEGPSRDEIEE